MPKINVYLSDELAAAVRQAGVPVSPVCQHALSEAVTAVTRARRAADAIRDPALTPDLAARLSIGVGHRMTDRLRTAIGLAWRQAGTVEARTGDSAPVSTGGLLLGLLDEGGNLALSILQSLDIDLDELRVSAQSTLSQGEEAAAEEGAAQETVPGAAGAEDGDLAPTALRLHDLTVPARHAVAAAIEAGVSLGHNYVGCEHLLLGLLDESVGEASQAGQVFGVLGVTSADVRRALKSAIAGFTHGSKWAQSATGPTAGGAASPEAMSALATRLEAVERRLGSLGG